jgi:hypothetical protein
MVVNIELSGTSASRSCSTSQILRERDIYQVLGLMETFSTTTFYLTKTTLKLPKYSYNVLQLLTIRLV